MQLVDNARQATGWLSMRLMALAVAAQTAWETLPPEAVAVIHEEWRGKITLGLIILAMMGRLVKQDAKA